MLRTDNLSNIEVVENLIMIKIDELDYKRKKTLSDIKEMAKQLGEFRLEIETYQIAYEEVQKLKLLGETATSAINTDDLNILKSVVSHINEETSK